jgi:hypothetical protein
LKPEKKAHIKEGLKNTGKLGGQIGNNNAEVWTEEEALKLGRTLLKWIKKPAKYIITSQHGNTIDKQKTNIFYKQFLLKKNLGNDIIADLSKKFPSFAELIIKAKEHQELKLNMLGVLGDTNSSMTKFCLVNNHKYADKVDHTTGGEPIAYKPLQDRISELKDKLK